MTTSQSIGEILLLIRRSKIAVTNTAN